MYTSSKAKHAMCAIFFTTLSMANVAHAENITLIGASSTYGYPLLSKWAKINSPISGVDYLIDQSGVDENVEKIYKLKVDFSTTEKPLTQDEQKKYNLAQFPLVIGAVVPIINLPNFEPGELQLNGSVLAKIFLGQITKWNDPEIQSMNQENKLPDLPIKPVYRTDPSGSSFILAHYFSKVSDVWNAQFGNNTTVKWPSGEGITGGEALAIHVKNTVGSIGYVEYTYARTLNYVALKNKNGAYVFPSSETFSAAVSNSNFLKNGDFADIMTDEPGDKSWPIVGATYALVSTAGNDKEHTLKTLGFFDWAYRYGSEIAIDLDYVPIPSSLYEKIEDAWKQDIRDKNNNQVWAVK